MLHLQTAQKKPFLESWLTRNWVLSNMLLSFVVKIARNYVNALGSVANFMSFEKRRTLLKAYIESQFNYYRLIWMFYSTTINKKNNHIHEIALRLVYFDHVSLFGELLKKHQSFSINSSHRNIQSLAIEIYQFFTLFLQVSWKMFSILTQIIHTTIQRSEFYCRN